MKPERLKGKRKKSEAVRLEAEREEIQSGEDSQALTSVESTNKTALSPHRGVFVLHYYVMYH